MRTTLRVLALAPVLVLPGCCANTSCECNDLYADALYFKLDASAATHGGFTETDIDTIYLLKYSLALPTKRLDSIALIRAQRRSSIVIRGLKQAGLDTISTQVLSNTVPFRPTATGNKLNLYNYAFRIYKGNTRRDSIFTFSITNITLDGRYKADGCCTCYENTQKAFSLNSRVFNVTEAGGPATPIVLSKH